MKTINVTIWNEFVHEREDEGVKAIYPEGIHTVIKDYLKNNPTLSIRTATLDQPSHGLTDEVLDTTDVLIWWGHMKHHLVSDDIVSKVCDRVMNGMGLICLHSAHASKVFARLCGTKTWDLKWRDIGEKEILWVVEPNHPIVNGISENIVLPKEEMYGERFSIPTPDELVFISWFEGGEVFRSGCTFKRGSGKIFYFRPGHESYPIYKNDQIMKVIENAVLWAAPMQYPKPVQGYYEKREY